MYKLIYSTLLSLLFLFLNNSYTLAVVKLLTPSNGSVTQNMVETFSWTNDDVDHNYIYLFEYSFDKDFRTSIQRLPTEELNVLQGLVNNKIMYWRVKYNLKETFSGSFGNVTDAFVLGVGREIPKETPEEIELEEPKPKTEEVEEKDIVITKKPNHSLKLKPSVKKILPPKKITKKTDEEFSWDITGNKDILGVQEIHDIHCLFKYLQGKSEKIYCNSPQFTIEDSISYSLSNTFSVIVKGNIQTRLNVVVEKYICKREIFDPRTWFTCQEQYIGREELTLKPNLYIFALESRSFVPVRSYSEENNRFSLLIRCNKSCEEMILKARFRIVISKYNIFEDLIVESPLQISKPLNNKKKPFSLPLKLPVGVTQWYGDTEYQKPHTGIDFGVSKKNILAVDDGEVVSVGIDKAGECNSGGRYLIVQQENGMYTGYFHLEKWSVNIGEKVKRNGVLGISGNSGSWNCQNLKDHLHFVIRKKRTSKSHVDPVEYIEAEWEKIPTLGYKQYPGRLSGNNPHPGR